MADTSVQRATRLRVDPIACDGVGICAHLAPDLIHADSWGYPLIVAPVAEHTSKQADAAVRACPHKALFLESSQRREN